MQCQLVWKLPQQRQLPMLLTNISQTPIKTVNQKAKLLFEITWFVMVCGMSKILRLILTCAQRIFSHAGKWDMILLVVAAVAAIGSGITMPLMTLIFGRLVGSFNDYFSPSNAVTESQFGDSIDKKALDVVYLFIGKFVLSYIANYLFRITSIRLSAAIRLHYLRALFNQSVGELDKLPPGEAAIKITGAANVLQIGISDKLATFLQALALVVSAYVVAFIQSWQLTLVTSSGMLFVIAVYSVVVPIWVKLEESLDHARGKATAIASETFGSIRMVVAYGAEKRVAERFSRWVEESRRRGLKMSPVLGLLMTPVFFAIYADFSLTFWFGIRLYMWGNVHSVSSVLIVLMSVLMSVMSLMNIATPINAAVKAATAASGFFQIIDRPVASKTGLKDPEILASDDITFLNVTFAYPSRPYFKVLDGLDIVFESGKTTALVGPSGSGKSTIVGLIERWYGLSEGVQGSKSVNNSSYSAQYHPCEEEDKLPVASKGSIMIGGYDIKDVDLKWWRSQIGLVQQEPFVFNESIFANVAYGLVGSQFENENEQTKRRLVKEACIVAFADDFITQLPEGYDTQVGDSGIKLSGGQRQRLAIARSVVKQPRILIFDEATSAIDVRSERIVQEALDRVAKDRTTITIAHRLSTIRKADKIVVVSGGKAVEQGTHSELVQRDGVYSNLVRGQQLSMNGAEAGAVDLRLVGRDSLLSNGTGAVEKLDLQATEVEEVPYKKRGIIRGFGLLLVEQRSHALWLALTVVGCLGAGSAMPLQAYLFANIVTVFQLSGHALVSEGQNWSLRFLYMAIGVGVSYFIVGWSCKALEVHVVCTSQQQYFEGIVRKPIRYFDSDENSQGSLISRISGDTVQLEDLMGLNMGFVYTAIFSLIGCITIAFVYGWKLTLVALVAALPITFTAGLIRLRWEVQFDEMQEKVFAESSQFAAEAFGAIRTVSSLTLEDMICQKYSELLEEHIKRASRKARMSTLVISLSDSINLLCMALTFWYGGHLLGTRAYDAAKFLVVYTAVIQGAENAGQWCSIGPNVAKASAAANRILSLRESGRSITKRPATELLSSDGVEIEFKNVHFKYPSRDIPIFAGLNLTVRKGQFVALVGASGDLDISEYRAAISLVAQEAMLFQGTIRENILLGVEGVVSEEELHQACRDAEIYDFISSLPEGYDTDIGSKGVTLSGGQKQRIAIARALVRKPRILLLDEATSSLDSESEKLVQAAFEQAGKGRTMLVVAHRLATVQNADVIFVLGSGEQACGARVLEKGTHSELVQMRGTYYQMVQSQALDQ
ncbi:uncharacterized protein TrAtP1_002633 [Trichoderma atroviride]|uniref:uncharacterized protein n=1 Tax=Hypocrea atroviridis TaxID=63577 RepID=UPI0033282CCD|nr:hypothetical protein TrAtP1_002633 [Trichoderma atroviride]